jgi:hypothetical protein
VSCNYRKSKVVADPSAGKRKPRHQKQITGTRPRGAPGEPGKGLGGVGWRPDAAASQSLSAQSILMSYSADTERQSQAGAEEAEEARRKAAEPRTRL